MNPKWFEANRKIWNERTPIHLKSDFYGVEGFCAGQTVLHDFELAEVGDVTGQSMLHLQCHFGLDSLDWGRRGAHVTGLDLSEAAIAAATDLATRVGVDARFVTANVYDTGDVLEGQFDILYTGRGALNWLPDIKRWAAVVEELIKPGGFLYLNEFHPLVDVYDDETFEMIRDYFGRPEGYEYDNTTTYVETEENTTSSQLFEWSHPISEVVESLLEVGLAIELFHEQDFSPYQCFKILESRRDGIRRTYVWPKGHPKLPLMYSIRARKAS